jgi:hypothetical protein
VPLIWKGSAKPDDPVFNEGWSVNMMPPSGENSETPSGGTQEPMTREDWLKQYDELIQRALESQKTRHPDFARETQKMLEEMEAKAAAKGRDLPKRSHLFAPENLWPDKYTQK